MNVVYTRKRMAFTEGNKEVMFAIHFERQGAFKYLRNWEDEQNVQKCSCKKSRNYMGKLNCSGALCMLSCNLCNPVDYSSPGSSIHGIFQVKILQWIAISFSKGFSLSRDEIFFFFNFRSLDVFCCFCIGRQILYHCTTWIAWIAQVKYLNSP